MPSKSSNANFPAAEDQRALLARLREWAVTACGLSPNGRLNAYITIQMLKEAGLVTVKENFRPGDGMGFLGALSLGIVKTFSIAAQACSQTLSSTGRPAQVTATATKGDQALEIHCFTGLTTGGAPMPGVLKINTVTIGTFNGSYIHAILNPDGNYVIEVSAGAGTPADQFKLLVHLSRR